MVDLTRTRVVIRAREQNELYDLALAVIRRDGWSLLRWWLIGTVPYLALMQGIVFLFFPTVWSEWPIGHEDEVALAFLVSCAALPPFWILTSPMTTHLGLSVFTKQPSFSEVWRIWRSRLPHLLLAQLFPFSSGAFSLSEVILLECLSPTTRQGRDAIRLRLRTLSSYGLSLSQLGGTFAVQTFVITGFVMAGILSCCEILDIPTTWGLSVLSFQIGLCVAGGFNRVVRFFLYLNSRIKYEGWDVELATRAAALRLAGKIGSYAASATPPPSPSQMA
ncbi:MAG: hypothetical protein ACUVQG_03915 [Thermogutta sp.]